MQTTDMQVTDTLVIGAGQAGIAMSEHLSKQGIAHIVLEKNRIAEAWRTRRWDSLVANGPCWHDRFPSMVFAGDQDAFVHHDKVAEYFEDYAKHINAPIQTGVEVTRVTPLNNQLNNKPNTKLKNKQGYLVNSSNGEYTAKRIVIATGAFQTSAIPAVIDNTAPVLQIHSDSYKNPQQLPDGNVLVVGSGSSGVQIASELNNHFKHSNREVYLSVGAHERPPRRYRGRDNVWWLGVLGGWDRERPAGGVKKGFAVSGANGGETVDFRKLAHDGVHLLGSTQSYADGMIRLNHDLFNNIDQAEKNYLELLDNADKFIADNGLELPEEPSAREFLPLPECIKHPLKTLNLQDDDIGSVIWATGFKYDYSWLKVDVLDELGQPIHKRGITNKDGIYFIGLPFLTSQGSSFIWGVWHDAGHIAEHIAIKNKYLAYGG